MFNYKVLFVLLFSILLMGNVFAGSEAPETTFDYFQIEGTTDANITLSCTDNDSGCKSINYNVNGEGWNEQKNFLWESDSYTNYQTNRHTVTSSWAKYKTFNLDLNEYKGNFLTNLRISRYTPTDREISTYWKIIYNKTHCHFDRIPQGGMSGEI